MSMSDGVHKYFLVYHDLGAMHFSGEKTLNELAQLAMRTDSWRDGYRQRLMDHITYMNELLVQYDIEMTLIMCNCNRKTSILGPCTPTIL